MIHSRIQTKAKEREGTERKRGGEREREEGREGERERYILHPALVSHIRSLRVHCNTFKNSNQGKGEGERERGRSYLTFFLNS